MAQEGARRGTLHRRRACVAAGHGIHVASVAAARLMPLPGIDIYVGGPFTLDRLAESRFVVFLVPVCVCVCVVVVSVVFFFVVIRG